MGANGARAFALLIVVQITNEQIWSIIPYVVLRIRIPLEGHAGFFVN